MFEMKNSVINRRLEVLFDKTKLSEGIFICFVGVKLYRINPCPVLQPQLLGLRGTAPGGRLKGRGSPPPPRGRGGGGPCCRLPPPPRRGLGDCWGCWSPGPEKSFSSPGGGALVVGTSQSSVGGVTQRLRFLSNTSMAGQRCSRG